MSEQPQYQAPQAQPFTVVNVSTERRGVNHPLHAVLTIVTCGLWAPVWIVVAILGRR